MANTPLDAIELACNEYDYCHALRETAFMRRWKVAEVVVIGGLDGMGKDAALFEDEVTYMLDRGWMRPGARLTWQGKTYTVKGCEMWPQWLSEVRE